MTELFTDQSGVPNAFWARVRRSPVLFAATVLCGFAVLVAIVGLVVDPTVVTGAPAWLKPLKFAISFGVYTATTAWMLSYVRGRRRLVAALSATTGLALLAELAMIVMQAARGTSSHFNMSTPFDAAVYSLMGLVIMVPLAILAITVVVLARQRGLPAPLGAGMRAGLVICLLGMVEAATMVAHSGHAVGGPDNGPGLPLIDWSTQYGDLRIGHLVGLHALQILPLVAFAVRRVWPRLGARAATRVVTLVAVYYAGAVVLLTWQALRAEPLLHPSFTVGIAALAWTVAAAAAVAAVAVAGRSVRTVAVDVPREPSLPAT